jgi:uncharacterized protein involved in outer membrane biogenesis
MAALALLVVLFDWNWVRPAVEGYLSKKSGREVRAGHLAISGLLSLEPTVTLRGVRIQNAPWADTRQPMAVAGEAAFTFSIRSMFDDLTIITKIELKDADVDMEKQADGLRNWRLNNPDDRGPPRIKVLRLEAHRSRLRLADRSLDYDIRFVASDAAPGQQLPSGRPLVTRVEATGVYHGATFTADTLTGAVLSFRETQQFFPVRGHATAGGTRLELDGEAADMLSHPLLDARVRIAGATLSGLHPFIHVQPAHSRPYDFEGHVRRTGGGYNFEKLRGRIGETDLAGDASHEVRGGRNTWRANLASASADLLDVASLAGTDYPDKVAPPDGKFFPRRPVRSDHLRGQDLHLTFAAAKLKARFMPALDSARFVADLHDGSLHVAPLDVGIAGGHAAGQLDLDASKEVPHARLAVKLSGLRLERLFPKLPEQAHKTGPLHGAILLEGAGNSAAAILGAGSGRVDVAIAGGSISNKLDARLSLNLGKMAGLFFRGDHDIQIYCAAAAFDFHSGMGKARALYVETEQTRIDGAGTLNLRDETADLVLVPRPKNPGLLTLGATIRVAGSLKHPAMQFHEGTADAVPVSTGARCAAPAAAVAAAH